MQQQFAMKNNYLSTIALNIQPYQWEGDVASGVLRFDTNTLPTPPPSVKLFLESMKTFCPINEYGDPTYKKLKKLVGGYEDVDPKWITITNSGDEGIDIVGKTFLNPGEYFIVTPPTYEMFTVQSLINKGKLLEVPLSKTFNLDPNTIIDQSKRKKVKLIFLCNPNSPTGSIIPKPLIERIVRESKSIVIVDECYREFYGESSVDLLKRYDNLVILRSFSKFAALAGARVGYLIASPNISEKFEAIRFPMGVSYFSYKLAEIVLENDQRWMKEQIAIIKKERNLLTEKLTSLGLTVYPSETNFLLVKIGKDASKVCKKLKKRGVLIRDRSKKKYLSGCVRITVRNPQENNALIKQLKSIYGTI